MENELKACPFCSSAAEKDKFGYTQCSNETCDLHMTPFTGPAWASRPLEDSLRAQLVAYREFAEAQAELMNARAEEYSAAIAQDDYSTGGKISTALRLDRARKRVLEACERGCAARSKVEEACKIQK